MVLGWTRNPGRRSAFPYLSRSLLKRTIGNFQRKYSWVLISSIFAPTGLLYVPSQHSEAWILIIYHPFPRPFLAYVMNCQILIVLQWHGLRINPFAKFWQYYIQCFILLFTKVNVLEEGSVKLLPRDLVALGCSALTSSKVCRHCFLNKIQLIKQTILINQSLFGSSRNLQKKHIGLCRGEHLIQLWLFFLRVLVMHFLTYILWCRAKSTEIFYPLTQYVNGIIHFTCTRFQRTY